MIITYNQFCRCATQVNRQPQKYSTFLNILQILPGTSIIVRDCCCTNPDQRSRQNEFGIKTCFKRGQKSSYWSGMYAINDNDLKKKKYSIYIFLLMYSCRKPHLAISGTISHALQFFSDVLDDLTVSSRLPRYLRSSQSLTPTM